jgi:DNA modification methylase
VTSWRILHGDLFDRLAELPDEHVHACVTDPPYGIGFMGREWDTFKPGTGATRKLMRETAKIVSDNPNLHGRHRSPALSPSQIDYDYSANGLRGFQDWTAQWAAEVYRVMKPGAYLVVCGAPRSHHRMMCGIEDAGFVIRDCFAWLFGSGFPKNHNLGDGKGTALKPAHEPIALAWKPFKGTIAACHASHGTAALNIEACRIEGVVTSNPMVRNAGGYEGGLANQGASGVERETDIGRWPANVLLDEDAAAQLDAQTGELTSGANPTSRGSDKFRDTYGEFKGQTECTPARGLDVGGASRFYYVAKPSRAERDAGCYSIEARPRDESRKAGNPGGDNPRNRGLQLRGNSHPTVKPVDLMRWLVRLVTPLDGIVLDPFTGSGTTGMACVAEHRHFIGCEREAEYVEIARARIGSVAPILAEEVAS